MLSWPKLKGESEVVARAFIESVEEFPLTERVVQAAIRVRHAYGLKLPEPIIAGTALAHQLTYVSSDKAFERVENLDVQLLGNAQ